MFTGFLASPEPDVANNSAAASLCSPPRGRSVGERVDIFKNGITGLPCYIGFSTTVGQYFWQITPFESQIGFDPV